MSRINDRSVHFGELNGQTMWTLQYLTEIICGQESNNFLRLISLRTHTAARS